MPISYIGCYLGEDASCVNIGLAPEHISTFLEGSVKGDRVSHDAITDNNELRGRVRVKRVAVNGGGRSMSSLNSHTSSAKQSICCGAGCEFWTLDCVPEPAVMLGCCVDPLEYWRTGVLWCWGGWLFAAVWM